MAPSTPSASGDIDTAAAAARARYGYGWYTTAVLMAAYTRLLRC